MSTDTLQLMALLHLAMKTAALAAFPLIGVGLSVGLLVGLLQAATQVNETALGFVPKLVATVGVLAVSGGFVLNAFGHLLRSALSSLAGGTP